jgi:DNA polymerase-4
MIIHIDMDAFYASVEIRDNPALRGKPVVVGGSTSGRGVIAAASYEARKFGVYSAMPASVAVRKCPNLVFVKSRMEHYAAISKQIREIFFRYTSLVEPLSLDEAFLDVTGSERLFGEAREVAREIKQAIREEVGLVASAGVAPNKFLAKLASDLEKPDGFTFVDPDHVQSFLDPLDVKRVWGVGPQTEKKLLALGVTKIRDLRELSKPTLKRSFGLNSDHFWRLSRGLDTRPVVPDRNAKSVSHETTFSEDLFDRESIAAWLLELTDQVGRRLRRHAIFGKTVNLKVRFSDFQTVTRSRTLDVVTQSTHMLAKEANRLLEMLFEEPLARGRSIRLIGMGVSQLSRTDKVQQSLFDQNEAQRDKRLDEAADKILDKFGTGSVRRGSSLKHGVAFRAEPRVNDD